MAFSLVYAIVRYHVFKGVEWIHLPLYVANKAISLSSVILISASYLVGRRLRRIEADRERQMLLVKLLGLSGFSLAAIHSLLSLALLSPHYYEKFFGDGKMNLVGELSMLFGAFSLFLFTVVACCSLPNVRESMGENRWRRLQRMGYVGLLLVSGHLLAMGLSGWLTPREWPGWLPPVSMVAFVAALAALLARVLPLATRGWNNFCLLIAAGLLLSACGFQRDTSVAPLNDTDAQRIQPWSQDSRYWQYKGEPVVPLGGTKDDNLFQLPDLEEHLDLLASLGGNYIRNTMSDRNDNGYEVHAFKRLPDGAYDLDQWNEQYWRRFESMLELTAERDIIVQIEVWDRFDHARENWLTDPFRPANNINYTAEETGLDNEYPDHPSRDKQPFFHTIAGMALYEARYDKLRHYQEAFVGKMLSYSLDHGNVLYCMDNETSTDPAWGLHWMKFITAKAAERGVSAYVTDMFDDGWKPRASEKLRQAFDQPELYVFIDISQINSRNFGEQHWRELRWVLEEVSAHPRPVNHVKIYGSGNTTWGSGSPEDGVERFWRDLIAGSATARFHRDGAGNGLKPIAQASLRAARKVESLVKFWDVEPRLDLLGEREENEAYLAAHPGEGYILYFTNGGSVSLDLTGHEGEFTLRWVDITSGEWAGEVTLSGGRQAEVAAPSESPWAAAIVPRS